MIQNRIFLRFDSGGNKILIQDYVKPLLWIWKYTSTEINQLIGSGMSNFLLWSLLYK